MSANGPLVVPLSQAHDAALAGGKALNLARLIQAGFPVPNGFVVTTEAFSQRRQREESHNSKVESGKQKAESLRAISEPVAAAILSAYHALGSPVVAVRSSATAEDLAEASMAGQYETILDIQGDAPLLDAIQRCWASLDSPRTRTYLEEHHLNPGDVAMAVVVQTLIPAEVSGVLFTANPRTGALGEMLIEATWGLGEALVSGLVQPDSLVLDRATGAVRACVIADKHLWIEPGSHAPKAVPDSRRKTACLTSKSVHELWTLGLRVMDHFGSAQDLEWAIHQGKLYLLQSRAITTLEDAEAYEQCLQQTREKLREARRAGRGEWVRHNLGETLPHPTPLTWSVIRRFMSGEGGYGAMYRAAGFEPAASVKSDGFLDLIAGRIYMDLSRAPEMFFENFPFRYDIERLRANPAAAQEAPSIPSGSALARYRIGNKLTAANAKLQRLAADFDQKLEREIIPAFEQWVNSEKPRDLRALSTAEWLAAWKEREARVMDEFAPQSLLPSLIAGLALEELRSFLAEHFWDEDAVALANALASGGPPDSTLQSNQGLYELAHGRLSMEDWLQRYGHRAPAEFDLATPRWRERPEAVRSMAAHLKTNAAPMSRHAQRAAEIAQRLAALESRLAEREGKELDARVSLAHRYLRFREDGKHVLMMGYDLLRDLALEAGRRLEIGEEVFLLTFEELRDALTTGFAPLHLLELRRLARSAEARLTLPHVISEADLEKLGEPPCFAAGQRLDGFPVSSGTGTGPARIVHSPEEAGDLGQGYVLVCPSTDPNWTPLFVNAAGLVLECGGMLSHGAVVAREMGIPAVVLPDATRILKEGETVLIDGRNGAVVRGELPSESALPPTQQASVPAVDPNDARISLELIPPPPGAKERRSASLRNVCLLLWGLYLVLAFLLPEAWLYRPSMNLLDAILWPVVAAWGKPAVVAMVAGILAALTMIGQRILTDHDRLVAAKRRANCLRREAAGLPERSLRRNALTKLAAPVQMRIMGAAFVPLAVILGPMVMTFLWFPERVDPASWNAKPGANVDVVAEIDGDFLSRIRIELDPALKLESNSPVAQAIPPIRATLERLLATWQKPSDLTTQPWEVRAAALRTREAMLADLSAYLRGPIPPQRLSWSLRTPENQPGRFTIKLLPENSKVKPPVSALVLGDAFPAAPKEVLMNPGSPIRQIKITYREQKTQGQQTFWAPLRAWGGKWDAGWLLTYLAVYLPVMFGFRCLLKIP